MQLYEASTYFLLIQQDDYNKKFINTHSHIECL